MITERSGDLLEQTDLDYVATQCNIFHVFGGGIARQIRETFPEVYAADCKTMKGDPNKIGGWSIAKASNGVTFFNVYSQTGLGGQDRQTTYDGIAEAFTDIRNMLLLPQANREKRVITIGVPYKYGCGLANGSWRIVRAIFEDIFGDSKDIELVIVRRPGD